MIISRCYIIRGAIYLVLAVLLVLLPTRIFSQTTTKIEITGLDGELLKQASENITVKSKLANETSRRTLDRSLRQAVAEIDNALRANGYYSAVITPHIEKDDEQRRFRFEVEKGKPVKVSRVHLEITGEGTEFSAFREWRSKFPLKSGDILIDARYEEAKTALQRAARKYGFFDGQFTRSEILIDRVAQQADILISFATGPRFLYSEIRLDQNYFDPDFLQRYFNIEPRQAFNNDDLQVLHQRFASNNYLSSIRVSP